MKTSRVTSDDLAGSVLAVPPLAWHADLTPNREANAAIVGHLEAGGVSTLMYGGNANFYNLGLADYVPVLRMLEELAGAETWVIPSVGPDYGKMMDQAPLLRTLDFPTAMVLPLAFPATPRGVEAGIRRFAVAYGRSIILYIKNEGYIEPEGAARLADDGLLCGIKYAIVRDDPAEDAFLTRLVELVDRSLIISGIGERPAPTHLRDFGLIGFTSGSVCLAPRASTAILRALKAGDHARALELREAFLPFEDQRDAISPLRVLHDGLRLAGIADTGPLLPLLTGLEPEQVPAVAEAAQALLAFERALEARSAAA